MGGASPSAEFQEKRPPGRPRKFDRTAALHDAMLVFWRRGYEGSSLTELTEAMGISRPSLYATFGDKAGLFRETIAAYIAARDQEYTAALALPTAREVAEALLRMGVHITTSPNTPSGCLLVQGALTGSSECEAVRVELAALREQGTAQLAERFQRARIEGDLPPDVDPEIVAQYLSCLVHGMAVQSASGVCSEHLSRVVDLVMTHWPVNTP